MAATGIPLNEIVRRVVAGQILFTAGNVLTTGGFLYYFANEFHPSAFLFALLQVAPEASETAGLLARPAAARLGGRKRTWIAGVLLGRLFALGVPAMAFEHLRPPGNGAFYIILGCVAGWYVCQGIAYVAYISWLSDLAPEQRWGRFFARRNIASLCVMLVVPAAAGWLRGQWLSTLPSADQDVSYAVIFLSGAVLVGLSVLPMLWLPDVPMTTMDQSGMGIGPARAVWRDRSFRFLLLHSWWLSLAQGLTQAAFFKYQVNVLRISLPTFYLMNTTMLLLQIPLSGMAGRISDRWGDRRPLLGSVVGVSTAMGFWMMATPERWWLLFGAYAVWGLFGMVNVCGQNLALRLAPAGDNTIHFALFRQIGGLLTATAGLTGGFWLDRLLEGSPVVPGGRLSGFHLIFAISWLGRATAALWLLPIRERERYDASGRQVGRVS